MSILDFEDMRYKPRGYSLPVSTGGPCQYLGSEILQKVIFGVGELQLRKKSISEV